MRGFSAEKGTVCGQLNVTATLLPRENIIGATALEDGYTPESSWTWQ